MKLVVSLSLVHLKEQTGGSCFSQSSGRLCLCGRATSVLYVVPCVNAGEILLIRLGLYPIKS